MKKKQEITNKSRYYDSDLTKIKIFYLKMKVFDAKYKKIQLNKSFLLGQIHN